MKIIRDAIHGDIELKPHEMRAIHTEAFQRLHGCRQLGLTHLVYPCAKHARFEHVLGVMHVATQIARRLYDVDDFFVLRDEKGKKYFDEPLLDTLRFASLLHDMGHVPFGHTLEDEMPVISKHDRPSVAGSGPSRMERAIGDVLRQSGNDGFIAPVLSVLKAIDASKSDKKLYGLIDDGLPEAHIVLADIIGNTICADLLDYIKRDHALTGIRGAYDERVFQYFGVGNHKYENREYKRIVIRLVKRGRVRGDALSELLGILRLRYNLSDKVLFHPKKCAADAMLIRAVSELEIDEDQLIRMSDDGFLDAHEEHYLIKAIRSRKLFKPVFSCGMDHIHSFDKSTKEDLVRRLHEDEGLRSKIEKELQRELGVASAKGSEYSVLIFCPRPDMTLKLVRVLVQWKDGTIRRLNEIRDDALMAQQVAALQDVYPKLWRLYLFVKPELRIQGARISALFEKLVKKHVQLTISCDPALKFYLDNCDDYGAGIKIEEELERHPAFGQMQASQKRKILQSCCKELAVLVANSNEEFEDDVQVVAHRESERSELVRGLVNKVMARHSHGLELLVTPMLAEQGALVD